MKTVQIETSRSYEVCIGWGILSELGERLRAVTGARTLVLVSDETVYALHGRRTLELLERAGYRVYPFVFPAGEEQKNLAVWESLLSFMARHRLTRSDAAVALGGGVAGDLAGFAAACYRRGIDYIQLPTTLLAAVDSSVGGKTGLNLPEGKNLLGAFHQPALVLCDTELLDTLPESVFRDGCAEVIKYALLGDARFFSELERRPAGEWREEIILRCVTMKRDIVAVDELDRGKRALLNLGHSFGHAIEQCSGYALSHGQAVAAGMAIVSRAGAAKGLCAPEVPERVCTLLQQYGLPASCEYPASAVAEAMLSDKKVSGDRLRLIVPERIGLCRMIDVPLGEISGWLSDGGVL